MKKSAIPCIVLFLSVPTVCLAGAASVYPACGSNSYADHFMLPGPGEKGYDAQLALKARRYDRQFHVFNALPMGVNADAAVPRGNPDNRKLIEDFINDYDGWDFEKFSGGRTPYDVIGGWQKVAGLYAGMGISADAFRYAALRDQGADCAEIDVAGKQLIASLDAMHIAFTITGKPGVVARGFIKNNLPGFAKGIKTVPLKDDSGRPLPLVKNNGVWREDFSGQYPDYYWEDSISRDQMLGWAMASAVAAEVMKDDPYFSADIKERLRKDSAAAAKAMRAKAKSGYDLEFPDADGRTTLYGYLNENNLDGQYMPGLKNGFYAMMALGIYSAFAYASEDPEAKKYLNDVLIKARKFPELAGKHMKFINMGAHSNFSNYNMVFTSAWLALRYIDDAQARAKIFDAVKLKLYGDQGAGPAATEMKQSLFDFIYASAVAGGSAFSPVEREPDLKAISNAIDTLRGFPAPPFWEFSRENCDKKAVESKVCILCDGTKVNVLGNVGWGDMVVVEKPVPMKCRPSSNYYWRSNPYEPNGGGNGDGLLPGVDFRVAYWLGRWTRVPGGGAK